MNFFLIIFSLLLEKFRPGHYQSRLYSYYTAFLHHLDELLNSGERHHGAVAWFVAVLPILFAYNLINYGLHYVGLGLTWFVELAVLASAISFRDVLKNLNHQAEIIRQRHKDWAEHGDYETPESAKAQSIAEVIEHAISDIHSQLLTVLFWFGVLPGVNGVILYLCASYLNRYWGSDRMTDFGYFSRKMYYLLNWPVYYLTALTFAVVGNFEDALYCWRTQGVKEGESIGPRVIFASAAGALGIRLGDYSSSDRLLNGLDLGLGELPELDHLKSVEGFIWRALMVWLVVFVLMTLAAHV